MKLSLAVGETFALDKIKITNISTKSYYLQKAMWKYGSRIFIVYFNFSAVDSTLMTFIAKPLIYNTYILLNFSLEGDGN